MEKRIMGCAILLTLSLVAFATGAGVSDEAVSTIRVPSDGKALAGKVVAPQENRPWWCCDGIVCPGACRCRDTVQQCGTEFTACEECEETSGGYRCDNWYYGDPGPMCDEKWRRR